MTNKTKKAVKPAQTEIVVTNTAAAEITPVLFEKSYELTDEQKVLNSKRYIRSGYLTYASPSEILKPLFDVIPEGAKISIKGSHEIANQNEDGTENIAFGRFMAILHYNINSEISYEVGLMAALDLGKPYLKIFRGARVHACTNLSIFASDDIVKFKLGNGFNQEIIQNYITSVSAKIEEVKEIVTRLEALTIAPEAVEQIVGAMLKKTIEDKTYNGINSVTSGTQLLLSADSKYYYKQENFNGWKLFNAFTENFSKTNFFDIPEKTRDVYQLLKSICLQ